MRKLWTKSYILIMMANFFVAIAQHALTATLPIYVLQNGGTAVLAGVMTAAQSIATVLFRPICGYFADRYGRKPTLLVGSIVYAVNCILYNFAFGLISLFVIRTLHGIGLGLFSVAANTIVADIVPEKRLVDGIGFYSISASLAMSLAPLMGSFIIGKFGYQMLFVVLTFASLLSLGSVFFIQVQPYERPIRTEKAKSSKSPLQFLELSVIWPSIVVMIIFLAGSSGSNYIPLYGLEKGISNISMYFLASGLCMTVSRIFAGNFSRKIGLAKAVSIGLSTLVVSYCVLASANSLWVIVIAGALNGLGNGIAAPIIDTLVYTLAPPDRRGTAQATFGVFTFLGTGVGPVLWAALSDLVGFSVVFLCAAVFYVIATILCVIFVRPKLKQTMLHAER